MAPTGNPVMLGENLAHRMLPPDPWRCVGLAAGAVEHRLSREALFAEAGTACPLTSDAPRPDRTATLIGERRRVQGSQQASQGCQSVRGGRHAVLRLVEPKKVAP